VKEAKDAARLAGVAGDHAATNWALRLIESRDDWRNRSRPGTALRLGERSSNDCQGSSIGCEGSAARALRPEPQVQCREPSMSNLKPVRDISGG